MWPDMMPRHIATANWSVADKPTGCRVMSVLLKTNSYSAILHIDVLWH